MASWGLRELALAGLALSLRAERAGLTGLLSEVGAEGEARYRRPTAPHRSHTRPFSAVSTSPGLWVQAGQLSWIGKSVVCRSRRRRRRLGAASPRSSRPPKSHASRVTYNSSVFTPTKRVVVTGRLADRLRIRCVVLLPPLRSPGESLSTSARCWARQGRRHGAGRAVRWQRPEPRGRHVPGPAL